MNTLIKTAAAVAISASTAFAGGVDRSGQSVSAIFEIGNYFEVSLGSVNPTVSGVQVLGIPPGFTGPPSGDMSNGYGYGGMALKMALNEKFDVALIYDEPFGATVTYPGGTGYFAAGSTAILGSTALTAIGRYKFSEKFSVYGGLRGENLSASAIIPFIPGGYAGSAPSASGLGFLIGAAYERPDIALRVALTYNSKIRHDLETTETSVILGAGRRSTTEVDAPQSINLDFQTGIAPKTLLFGGVRWVDWSEFKIAPADYSTIVGLPLVSFADDTITYSLGVGRQLSENWSVAVSATHEPGTGGLKSNLAPTDGRSAVGVGVTYRQDGFKLQAGLQHLWIGDATTRVGASSGGVFSGNTAIAFGLKAGFSF